MARIDSLRQDGEWSQSPSRSFMKNMTNEIFVKIYRLVVYVVETYIGIYYYFLGGGGGGGVGEGMYTCEMIPKNTDMIIFLRLLLFLHWKLVSILFYSRERNLLLKREKKMQRHHTRLHLRKWKSTSQANSSFKANPPCFNVRMLITSEIIGQ